MARYSAALCASAFDYRRPRAFRWPLRVRAACIVGASMTLVVFIVFIVAAQGVAAYVRQLTTYDPLAAKFLVGALNEAQAASTSLQRLLNGIGLNTSACQRYAPAFNFDLAAAVAGANAGISAADIGLGAALAAANATAGAALGPAPVLVLPSGANLTCTDVARAFELLAALSAYRLPSLDLTGSDLALFQSALISGVVTLFFSLLAWATVLPEYKRSILALRRGRYSFEVRQCGAVQCGAVQRGAIDALAHAQHRSHIPCLLIPIRHTPSRAKQPYFFTPDRAATLIVLCFFNSFLQFLLLASVLTIIVFLFTFPLTRSLAFSLALTLLGSAIATLVDYFLRMCIVRAFFLEGVWMKRPCCFRLFEVSYLLYTTVSGAFSAAVRQVYAVLLNLLVLLRPDLRIFPLFATLDVVHGAYLAALFVDHAHTNPVLRAAVEAWVRGAALRAGRAAAAPKASEAEAGSEAKADAEAAHVLARNRWQLAVTLLRNPQLAALRKHRLEAAR